MSKFATCLNCIDGRVQLPVLNWITVNYEVDYVDMITEPGVDGLFSDSDFNIKHGIIEKMNLSLGRAGSSIVFLVGHHDCLANSVDDETHKIHIQNGVKKINGLTTSAKVIGLWVNKEWTVEKLL